VFLATTRPDNGKPLQRLMLDRTGGAIKARCAGLLLGLRRKPARWREDEAEGGDVGAVAEGMELAGPVPSVMQPAVTPPVCVPGRTGSRLDQNKTAGVARQQVTSFASQKK